MADPKPGEIDDLLREDRAFPPPPAFRDRAQIRDERIYADAERDPDAFWARMAGELEWSRPWDTVLDWRPPHAKWFVGGQLNASVNCLDRHVRGPRRNKAALIWEGEPGDRRTLTYFDLYREVSAFANVLKSLGIKKGDRVAIYLPLIPELAISMLACARIGAIHSVVFGGFASHSLASRIDDAFAINLEKHPQHPVRRRVLRTKIYFHFVDVEHVFGPEAYFVAINCFSIDSVSSSPGTHNVRSFVSPVAIAAA